MQSSFGVTLATEGCRWVGLPLKPSKDSTARELWWEFL